MHDVLKGVADSKEYVEALEFARKHEPAGRFEDADYAWVLETSTAEYDRSHGALQVLDEKASSVVTQVGAFVGLSVVAALSTAKQVSPIIALLTLPGILVGSRALLIALSVREVRAYHGPADTKTALEYAEAYPPKIAVARFALMNWAAAVSMRLTCERLGAKVQEAIVLLRLAVLLMALPAAVLVGQSIGSVVSEQLPACLRVWHLFVR